MELLSARPVARIAVLQADVELGAAIGDARRPHAESASVARVIRRPAGIWDAREDGDLARGGAGLLVIAGMLVRRVDVADRSGAELLSAGDILQPWQHDGEEATVPFGATWRILDDLRLAVLDVAWLTRMAPFPEVAAALIARALLRSRRLVSMQAISQQRSLDERMHLLLWELADRHGRVTPAGVQLDLGLTHEMLGYLAGARRPSVSAALARLERAQRLSRAGGRWLLLGGPPG
jgi:CRP/FNR family cyclic AMP-dependent transcriptional regulator